MKRAPIIQSAAGGARAWQRMLSGRRLDLLNPTPLDIEIEDIAHGLARVARWNGQTSGKHAFSVAEHSLLVERIAGELEPKLGADFRPDCPGSPYYASARRSGLPSTVSNPKKSHVIRREKSRP